MANMPIKQYQEMTGTRHKYNNKPVVVDGVRYDSKKEYARWVELTLLQKAGEIDSLQRQKKFVLRPAFTHKGKKIRAMTYYADFYYYDMTPDRRHSKGLDSRWVIEDVKSPITRKDKVYCIKKNEMLYKGLEIKEV